jgi:hypothetical protein
MNHRGGLRNSDDRFGIIDLTRLYQLERIRKRHPNYIDLFIIIEILLGSSKTRR